MAVIIKRYGDIRRGDVVWIAGYQFRVTGKVERHYRDCTGQLIPYALIRFDCACTDNPVNHPLKGTGYYNNMRGGAYDWVTIEIERTI
jgi:hypothetical protein